MRKSPSRPNAVKRPLKVRVRVWLAVNEKTQQWLAEQAGIANSNLSRILNGKAEPTLKQAITLAKITGIPVEEWSLAARHQLKEAV